MSHAARAVAGPRGASEFLDYKLPDTDGVTVLRKIKDFDQDILAARGWPARPTRRGSRPPGSHAGAGRASIMISTEIPRGAWTDELNAFTTEHQEQPVSLEVFGAAIGAQPEVTDLPLLGISADRLDDDGTITISVARTTAEHLTHIIRDVRRLLVERTETGATVALLIESADGTRTLLRVGQGEA